MDIRFICWAGYDLLGAGVTIMQPASPGVQGEKLSKGVDADYSDYSDSKTVSGKTVSPSVTSKISAPSMNAKPINTIRPPFPRPRNTL